MPRPTLFEQEKFSGNSVKQIAFANKALTDIPMTHDRYENATTPAYHVSPRWFKPGVMQSVVKPFSSQSAKHIFRRFSSKYETVDHLRVVRFQADFDGGDRGNRSRYTYQSGRCSHGGLISVDVIEV